MKLMIRENETNSKPIVQVVFRRLKIHIQKKMNV